MKKTLPVLLSVAIISSASLMADEAVPTISETTYTFNVPAGEEKSYSSDISMASVVNQSGDGSLRFTHPIAISGSAKTFKTTGTFIFDGIVSNLVNEAIKLNKLNNNANCGTVYFNGGINLKAPGTWLGEFNAWSYKVYLCGGNPYYLGYTQVYGGGEIHATNENTSLTFRRNVFFSYNTSRTAPAKLVISGGANLASAPIINLNKGGNGSYGVVELSGGGNANIQTLNMGAYESYNDSKINRHGVVFQKDGDVKITTALYMAIGNKSRAYYTASNGDLNVKDAYLGIGGDALLYADNSDVDISGAAYLSLTGGTSVVWMKNGKLTGTINIFDGNTQSGARSIMALEGSNAYIEHLNGSFNGGEGTEMVLALKDGATLSGSRFVKKSGNAGKLYVNSDGGVFNPTYKYSWDNGSESAAPDEWIVHEGGIVFDTDVEATTLVRPLLSPQGKIVSSISLPQEALDDTYFSPPPVVISGNGRGAGAVAIFNKETGKLTSIEVVAHGTSYDDETTATIKTGDGTSTYTCSVTLVDAPTSGKGFVKRGSGSYKLANQNTYYGPTTVEEGTLEADKTYAIPHNGNGGIVMRGGTFTVKNYQVNVPCLSVEGASTLNCTSGIRVTDTLSLTNSLDATLTITKKLTLADGVKITLSGNLNEFKKSENATVLLTAEGGIDCEGALVLPDIGPSYYVKIEGNNIVAGFRNGLILFVK